MTWVIQVCPVQYTYQDSQLDPNQGEKVLQVSLPYTYLCVPQVLLQFSFPPLYNVSVTKLFIHGYCLLKTVMCDPTLANSSAFSLPSIPVYQVWTYGTFFFFFNFGYPEYCYHPRYPFIMLVLYSPIRTHFQNNSHPLVGRRKTHGFIGTM